jgi:hypothetical protein
MAKNVVWLMVFVSVKSFVAFESGKINVSWNRKFTGLCAEFLIYVPISMVYVPISKFMCQNSFLCAKPKLTRQIAAHNKKAQ